MVEPFDPKHNVVGKFYLLKTFFPLHFKVFLIAVIVEDYWKMFLWAQYHSYFTVIYCLIFIFNHGFMVVSVGRNGSGKSNFFYGN